jgi:hypothetical protein
MPCGAVKSSAPSELPARSNHLEAEDELLSMLELIQDSEATSEAGSSSSIGSPKASSMRSKRADKPRALLESFGQVGSTCRAEAGLKNWQGTCVKEKSPAL